jgi:hypothetical protein
VAFVLTACKAPSFFCLFVLRSVPDLAAAILALRTLGSLLAVLRSVAHAPGRMVFIANL